MDKCKLNMFLRKLLNVGIFFFLICIDVVKLTLVSFRGGKKYTKYHCIVNLIITESCVEPHTASLLKGAARVMHFSQGAKCIFKKLFLQVLPLTYLTSFCTDWVIWFSCQSNLFLSLSHGIQKNKTCRETNSCSWKKPKQPTNKPKFDSITIKLSEEGTKFMCGVGLEVGWGIYTCEKSQICPNNFPLVYV